MFCTGGEGEAERVRAGWKQETPSGVLSAASGSRLKVFTPPFGKKKKMAPLLSSQNKFKSHFL